MKKYNVFDIDWDVDDPCDIEDCGLPTEVVIEAEDEDEIADALSDEYGFCVNSFSIG